MITTAAPHKLLDLPDGLRTKAFRGVEVLLREHPILAEIVTDWRSLEGLPNDLDDPAPVAGGAMIALSPIPYPDTTLTIDRNKVNFGIAVLVAVVGGCVDDQMNLWDQVLDAVRMNRLTDRGVTVQDYLSCGIPGVSIPFVAPPVPAYLKRLPLLAAPPPGADVTMAEGVINFFFQVPR